MSSWRSILAFVDPPGSAREDYTDEPDFGAVRTFRVPFNEIDYGNITVSARCKEEAKTNITNGWGDWVIEYHENTNVIWDKLEEYE